MLYTITVIFIFQMGRRREIKETIWRISLVVHIALITEGCFEATLLILLLFLVVFRLSKRNLLISGGGLERSTTSLSSFMFDPGCPKNLLVLSRLRSNFGGSLFSLNPRTIYGLFGSIDEDLTLAPLMDNLRTHKQLR